MRQNLIINWVKRNNKLLLVSLLVIFISGGLVAQKTWTLRECIEYALENNIEVKKSELNSETSKIAKNQQKLSLLPSLNANTSYTFGFGRTADNVTFEYVNKETQQASFGLSSAVTLFDGFQKINTLKQAHFDYLASKYESDRIRDDISLRVAAGYLSVLYSMELVEKSEAQLEVTRNQISNTQKHVKAGTLPKGDLLEMQSQNALEEVNLIRAQNQLSLAYLDLKQLLELESGEELQIAIPQVDVSFASEILNAQEIFNVAVNRLPQIKSAEYQLRSAEKGISIAKGGWSPTITAYGGWRSSYSDQQPEIDPVAGLTGNIKAFKDQFDDNQSEYIQIGLNLPIFNGWLTNSNISRSKLNALTAEYNLELTKNQVRKSIEQAYSDALAAYKTYNASLRSVASFKESFKYMERKFSVGMENSLNYNMSKAQLTRSESDLISAKYDYIFKTKILDFYTGIPLSLDGI